MPHPIAEPGAYRLPVGTARGRVGRLACALLLLCAADLAAPQSQPPPVTTFDKHLLRALQGDAGAMNFIAFMLYHGEGVEQDLDEAHYWFHEAAEHGSVLAARNLGMLHSHAIRGVPEALEDAEEANYWFSRVAASGREGAIALAEGSRAAFFEQLHASLAQASRREEAGRRIFTMFCAGCHGFDGIAAYPAAPSFARGERLEKDDPALLQSIRDGIGVMPAWRGTLSDEMLLATLAYIRGDLHRPAEDPAHASKGAPVPGAPAGDAATYERFCAGCHGLNGVAYYVNSPSFALGERLEKSDAELAASIANGIGEMPKWDYLVDPGLITGLVRHVRELERSFQRGIIEPLHGSPDRYYLFRDTGEHMRKR